MYEYPYPPPSPAPRHPLTRWRGPLLFLATLALVAVGVAVYVFLTRLSNDVLVVIATIGCAAGVALPGTLLALVVLLRRAETGNARREQYPATPIPATTPPTIMVVPPMALPSPQATTYPTWDAVTTPRRFTVVGEGCDAE